MYAAGLTMKIENFPEFKKKFTKYVEEHITNEQKTPVLEADMLIELKDITPKFTGFYDNFLLLDLKI
jgi:single-stranded-DNA-specific exonuclease